MTQHMLTSAKGSRAITGDLAAAMRAALEMDAEWQAAYGVTIETADGRVFEARDGRIAVETCAGDDDDEAGYVVMVDGDLMIAWQQGTLTPFFDQRLIAG